MNFRNAGTPTSKESHWCTRRRCGLPANKSFAGAHLTSTSIMASGKFARSSWISGVAISVSPMPAMEMTRIFIYLGGTAFGRPNFSSGTATRRPSHSKPGNLFQQRRRGFARHERNDHNFPARRLHRAPLVLVQRVQGVIAAFDVNIRSCRRQEFCRRFFRENANPVHARQCGEYSGAVGFDIYRSARALQLPCGLVAVDADQQRIAEIARRFEVGYMTQMQDVETAVGDDQFPATGAHGRPPLRQFVPRNGFLTEVHAVILPVPRRLAMI